MSDGFTGFLGELPSWLWGVLGVAGLVLVYQGATGASGAVSRARSRGRKRVAAIQPHVLPVLIAAGVGGALVYGATR